MDCKGPRLSQRYREQALSTDGLRQVGWGGSPGVAHPFSPCFRANANAAAADTHPPHGQNRTGKRMNRRTDGRADRGLHHATRLSRAGIEHRRTQTGSGMFGLGVLQA